VLLVAPGWLAGGGLGASGTVLARSAFDLALNPNLPESLAHPREGRLPVSGGHKFFVGLTVTVVLLNAAAVAGHLPAAACTWAWAAYALLRGLVLSSIRSEAAVSFVQEAMFPNFQDRADDAGFVALAWAIPAAGRAFLCLSLQAMAALAAGGRAGWPSFLLSLGVFGVLLTPRLALTAPQAAPLLGG